MVLADTSVWIEHLRKGKSDLAELLFNGLVLIHPFVSGELACGNLANRETLLANLTTLPSAAKASDGEVLRLIADSGLWGRGLGLIDVHLVASALLSRCRLWTLDKRLASAAIDLGLG